MSERRWSDLWAFTPTGASYTPCRGCGRTADEKLGYSESFFYERATHQTICPDCFAVEREQERQAKPKPRRRRDLSGHGDGRDSVYVKVHPGIYSGAPCIVWRISPEQMAETHWWGHYRDFAALQRDYQSVTRAHVLVACWYLGTYSRSQTYRRRYGVWAKYAHSWLWSSDYDTCPDPPTETQPVDEAALEAAHRAYLDAKYPNQKEGE